MCDDTFQLKAIHKESCQCGFSGNLFLESAAKVCLELGACDELMGLISESARVALFQWLF